MSQHTSSDNPTILSPACLKELANLAKEAQTHINNSFKNWENRDPTPDTRVYPVIAMQELRNTYATIKRALTALEVVGKKNLNKVNNVEEDYYRMIQQGVGEGDLPY